MPRRAKPEKPTAEVLAPIPAEILDQIVRDGPADCRRNRDRVAAFKKALIERALRRRADPPPRLPTRSRKARARDESSQRHQWKDRPHRRWASRD